MTSMPAQGARTGRRPPLTAVTIVVPARNEEVALPATTAALHAAVLHAGVDAAALRLRTLVVLDRCTDASEAIVRARGLDVAVSDAGSVGVARTLGFAAALADHEAGGGDPATLWIATTDADSRVPAHWLSSQILAADRGADVLVGTVEPDEHLPARERAAWMARHHLAEGHPHVHGANLGVRASAYLSVGGFAPLAQHEDVDLVERLRADPKIAVRATDTHRVITSSRLVARAEGGFAGYLRTMKEAMP